jgi:hypothetical protein
LNNTDSINRKRTTISISESVRDQIAELGHIGITYEEVLTPLVKTAKVNKATLQETTS